MEAVVKVQGDIARVRLERKRIANSSNMPDFVEVRIKLKKNCFLKMRRQIVEVSEETNHGELIPPRGQFCEEVGRNPR
jgi:hypothetical protein